MELKAVIFDYGGVICFHPPEHQVNELVAATGVPKDVFLEHYWGMRFAYDRGDVTGEDYWHEFARRTGRTFTEEQIADFIGMDIRFWLHIDGRMLDWARSLKRRGLRIGLLSNMPCDLGEHMKQHCAWLAEFDHVTLSYEVRSAKPEAAIYRDAVEGTGVAPAEALFLDDRIENVSAAEEAGLHAALFESAEAFSEAARDNAALAALAPWPVA